MEISLLDQPETFRNGLAIGPDGRLNYLEARDFMASGLTVDELRDHLAAILIKSHRSPIVIVNPTAYNSKKYFILGDVNQKGIFSLDRPLSIVEAIARAKGFTSELHNRNTIVSADLARSFLVRKGPAGAFGYIPIDFEALFLQGDLSQNIALQPDDYLFFPPIGLQEVYVLGQVKTPGTVTFTPNITVLGAITSRGGFTEQAWKTHILVVRGSLANPKTFMVNISQILSAKGLDFPLSNRDIVFVHYKPWAKAEELLESALTDFARAFAIGLASQNVGPFITKPLIK
jgi:protein involved in polysaccharide export with SLBB domain